MERLLASDPHYEEVNRLYNMLVLLKNVLFAKHMGKGFVVGQLVDLDGEGEVELRAMEATVLREIDSLLGIIQIDSLREVYGPTIEGLKL